MDRLLFEMPEVPEAFLAALANVQAFLLDIKVRADAAKVALDFSLTLIARKELQFLLAALPIPDWAAVEEVHAYADHYDMVFSFNEQVAYKLSFATEKHITQAFGLLLGANPESMPDLSRIPFPGTEETGKIIYHLDDTLASKETLVLLESTYPELEFAPLTCYADCQETFGRIASCSGVIGTRSFATYVAACLKKYVVELYPATRHRRWLSKWSCKTYQMVYGPDYKPQYIVNALETIWRRTDSAACQLAVAE